MEKHENLHKELDLIQNIITRMSNNSFLVKGWTITLISALIVFGKDVIMVKANGLYYLITIMLIVIPFWWLDAFFLHREKIFRKLYHKVISDPEAKNRLQYNLHPDEVRAYVKSIWSTMISNFLFWFYSPIIFLIFVSAILKLFKIY